MVLNLNQLAEDVGLFHAYLKIVFGLVADLQLNRTLSPEAAMIIKRRLIIIKRHLTMLLKKEKVLTQEAVQSAIATRTIVIEESQIRTFARNVESELQQIKQYIATLSGLHRLVKQNILEKPINDLIYLVESIKQQT